MWFYIPITLSLLVNVIGCIMIVWTIFNHDRGMKRMKFNIRDANKRDKKMNRCAKFYSNCTRKELIKQLLKSLVLPQVINPSSARAGKISKFTSIVVKKLFDVAFHHYVTYCSCRSSTGSCNTSRCSSAWEFSGVLKFCPPSSTVKPRAGEKMLTS